VEVWLHVGHLISELNRPWKSSEKIEKLDLIEEERYSSGFE